MINPVINVDERCQSYCTIGFVYIKVFISMFYNCTMKYCAYKSLHPLWDILSINFSIQIFSTAFLDTEFIGSLSKCFTTAL